jgi:dCMP deaminase
MKREEYISRDEYFMGIALLSAHRSKDPITQVGACIVNNQQKIIGIGYNGFPTNCSDEHFPREKSENMLDDKRTYVVHAEANAILNANQHLDNCKMYVSLFPCNECAKLIIQAGIKKIIYLSDEDAYKDYNKAAKKMFEHGGVSVEKLTKNTKTISLYLA